MDTLVLALRTPSHQEPVIICKESRRFYVAASLRETGTRANILLVPHPRNRASALALSALDLTADRADPLKLVLPSDHVFKDVGHLLRGVEAAAPITDQNHIVTLGITPTGLETDLGYIEASTPLGDGGFSVGRFVEMPMPPRRRRYWGRGFLWNRGIFLMRTSVYLRLLERFAPEIAAACPGA